MYKTRISGITVQMISSLLLPSISEATGFFYLLYLKMKKIITAVIPIRKKREIPTMIANAVSTPPEKFEYPSNIVFIGISNQKML
jgi:hypothetical protein